MTVASEREAPSVGRRAGVTAPAYLSSEMTTTHTLPAAQSLRPVPLPVAARPGYGPGVATARSLARRLALALHDLGLDRVLPAGWAGAEGAGLRFGDLDVAGADRLVRHLEDLAAALGDAALSPPPAQPGPDQTTLFSAAG